MKKQPAGILCGVAIISILFSTCKMSFSSYRDRYYRNSDLQMIVNAVTDSDIEFPYKQAVAENYYYVILISLYDSNLTFDTICYSEIIPARLNNEYVTPGADYVLRIEDQEQNELIVYIENPYALFGFTYVKYNDQIILERNYHY